MDHKARSLACAPTRSRASAKTRVQYLAGVDSHLPGAAVPRITVRQMETVDIPTLAALLCANAEWVGRYKKGPPRVGRDVVRLLTRELAAQTRGSHWFGVVLLDSAIVGQVSLRPMSASDPRTEFTIWLSEEASGRGIGRTALRQLCEVAFAEQRLSVLYGRILQANRSSLAVAAAAGFEVESPNASESLAPGMQGATGAPTGKADQQQQQRLVLVLTRERWSRAELSIKSTDRADSRSDG